MSYMQNNLAFAGGIQELSLDEIEFVGGGADSATNSSQAERDAAARLSAANSGAKYVCLEVSVKDTDAGTPEKRPAR